jgi:hypothetical protein
VDGFLPSWLRSWILMLCAARVRRTIVVAVIWFLRNTEEGTSDFDLGEVSVDLLD